MSVPGFTDGGGGGVKTPEELVAATMGFTEDEQGQAYVPPPPPPPAPIPQAPVGFTEEEQGPAYAPAFEEPAYDPWTDELSSTTPEAPYWEPPPPPPATGVDYFGLDDATAYQGDPNGPSVDYVSDTEMFSLPELGIGQDPLTPMASGIDYFNMGASDPMSYAPDYVHGVADFNLPTFEELGYGLQSSMEMITGINTRINEILGFQDPNATELVPTPDSEMGIALASGDYARYDALVAEYQGLLSNAMPLYESYQQQASQYNALTSMGGEGSGRPTESMFLSGVQTPFEGIVGNLGVQGLQGGEGFGSLPQPVDVRNQNLQNYAARDFNAAQLDAERLAQQLQANAELITMEIYESADPTTQAEMRSWWIEQGINQAAGTLGYDLRSGNLNTLGVVPDRMIFGDTFVARDDMPTYFNESEVSLDERNRFHRVGDSETLRSGLPDPYGGGKGGVNRALGAVGDTLNFLSPLARPLEIAAGVNLALLTPAAPLVLISSRTGGWVPDLSAKNLGITAWKDLGGRELVTTGLAFSEFPARSYWTIHSTTVNTLRDIRDFASSLTPTTNRPITQQQTIRSGQQFQQQLSGNVDISTLKRRYTEEYNSLPFAARLGLEAIADPFGLAVVGPSLFRPAATGVKAVSAANRARQVEKVRDAWTLRNWVTQDEWTKFFEVTAGGGGSIIRTPRDIRNVQSLATTMTGSMIRNGIITKAGDPETMRGIGLAITTRLALQTITSGYRTGFDKLTYNTEAFQVLKEARQFAVDNLGYSQKEAEILIDLDPQKVEKWATDVGVIVEVKRDPTLDPVQLKLQQDALAVGALDTTQPVLIGARTANPVAQKQPLPLPRGFQPAPARVATPLAKLSAEQKTWLNELHINTQVAKSFMNTMRGSLLNDTEMRRIEDTMNRIAELAVRIHVSGAGNVSDLMAQLDEPFADIQKLADEYQMWRETVVPAQSARSQLPLDRKRGRPGLTYNAFEDLIKTNEDLQAVVRQFEARLADIETRLAKGEEQLRGAASSDPIIPELAEAYTADISLELLTQIERLSRNYGQNFWATIKAEGGGQITRAAALDWYQRFTAAEVKGATAWQKALLHNVYAALDGHPVDPDTPKGRWASQVEEIYEHGTVSDINQLIYDIERGTAVPGREPLRFTTVEAYIQRNPGKVFRKNGEISESTTKEDYKAAGYGPYDKNAPPSYAQLKTLARMSESHQRDLIKLLEDSPVISYTRADEIMNTQPITPQQRAMLDQTFKRGAITKSEYDEYAVLTHKQFATRTDKGKEIGENGEVIFTNDKSILNRRGNSQQAAVNKVFLAGDWSYSEAELRQHLVTRIVDMLPAPFTFDPTTGRLGSDPDVPKFAFGAPGDEDAVFAISPHEFRDFIKKSGIMHKRKGGNFNSKWYATPIRRIMDSSMPAFDPDSADSMSEWQKPFMALTERMTSDRVKLNELHEFSELMLGFYKQSPEFTKPQPTVRANPFADRPLEAAVQQLSDAFTTWMARGSTPQTRDEYRQLYQEFSEEYVTRKGMLTPEELPPYFPNKASANQAMTKSGLEEIKEDLRLKGVAIPGEGFHADVNAILISRFHEQSMDLIGDAWLDILDAPDDLSDLGAPIRPWLDDVAEEAAAAADEPLTPVTDDVPWTDPVKAPDQAGVIRGSLVSQGQARPTPAAAPQPEIAHPDPFRQAPPASVTLTASGNAQRSAYLAGLKDQADLMGWAPATRAGATVVTDILALRAVADGWIADVGEYYKFGKADAQGFYQSGVKYSDEPPTYSNDLGTYTRGVSGLDTRGNPINPTAHTPDPRPYIGLFKQRAKPGQTLTDTKARAHTVVTYLHENFHHFMDLMPDAQAKALYEAAIDAAPGGAELTRRDHHPPLRALPEALRSRGRIADQHEGNRLQQGRTSGVQGAARRHQGDLAEDQAPPTGWRGRSGYAQVL
jgi:hypothetical protein